MQRELSQDGLLLRYRPDADGGVDGLPGREGAVPGLQLLAGRRAEHDRPRATRPSGCSSGCSACATTSACSARSTTPRAGRQVGNTPQAFSHVGLVNTARQLRRVRPPHPLSVPPARPTIRVHTWCMPSIAKSRPAETTPQVVVVTGASGGIGRATAVAFARRGDRVALLARGEVGPAGGGRRRRGRRAARRSSSRSTSPTPTPSRPPPTGSSASSGPIDVWCNVAFTSVFAPFAEISAAEYARVTEVTYLGFVHGTHGRAAPDEAAGPRRHRADRLGAGLPRHPAAERLLRRQARHPGLHRVAAHASCCTTAATCTSRWCNMPGVNTPQFDWVLQQAARSSRSRWLPSTPPSSSPRRWCGRPTTRGAGLVGGHPDRLHDPGQQGRPGVPRLVPGPHRHHGPADHHRRPARTTRRTSGDPADGEDGHDFGADGRFTDGSWTRDPQVWASRHHGTVAAAGVAALAGTAALLRRRAMTRHSRRTATQGLAAVRGAANLALRPGSGRGRRRRGPRRRPPARWLVRLLGVRVVLQQLVVLTAPTRRSCSGAVVDGLHAASMLAAAWRWPQYRRPPRQRGRRVAPRRSCRLLTAPAARPAWGPSRADLAGGGAVGPAGRGCAGPRRAGRLVRPRVPRASSPRSWRSARAC